LWSEDGLLISNQFFSSYTTKSSTLIQINEVVMNRIAQLLFAVLLASFLVLIGCSTPSSAVKSETTQSSSGQETSQMIRGTWNPLSAELAGQPFPQQVLNTIQLILTEDRYTAVVAGAKDVGNLTLHSNQQPKALDILGTEGPNKGRTILAIFELAGDSLKICYDLEGKTRPAEFKTNPGTKQFLVHYKRVAK
jgi:uncharacterized protein (TIGR03067 family)